MSAADAPLVPAVRPTVVSVELDGERVLYDTATGQLHQLDAVGSIVWSCFDGTTDVDEISADLSEAFGADRARVRSDIETLVRQLAAENLLDIGQPEPGLAEPSDDPHPAAGDLAVLSDPPGG